MERACRRMRARPSIASRVEPPEPSQFAVATIRPTGSKVRKPVAVSQTVKEGMPMASPSKPEYRCSVQGAQLASRIDSPKCWRSTHGADFADPRPGIFPAPDRSISAGRSRVGTTECESGSEWGVADMPNRNADRPPCQLVPTPRSADCRSGIRRGGNHASSPTPLDIGWQTPSPLNAGKIADDRQRLVVARGAR